MKKYFFILLILPVMTHARIIETAYIDEAILLIEEDALVMVDIDHTLFQAKQSYGHLLWIYKELENTMQKGLTREEAVTEIYPAWEESQKLCEVQPLEPNFISHLLELQKKDVTLMGFTQRPPSIADSTLRQVQLIGFDFCYTAPLKETFSIPFKHPPLYIYGILFASDYNSKGETILPFLRRLQEMPKKVIMIDDKLKNLEELEEVFSSLKIPYLGIHYTAIERVPSTYDPKFVAGQVSEAPFCSGVKDKM